MNHLWAATLACNSASRKRRRRRRYDLGTPPEGYEKTPDGGPNSYRRERQDGSYDYWYDEEASSGGGTATAEAAPAEKLPEWVSKADHYLQANFEVDGTPFKFMAHQVTKDGPFEITFSQIKGGERLFKQEKLASKTSALKVFSTVKKLVEKFLAEKNPKQFKFSADMTEPARVRLYEKMAERFGAGGKYKMTSSISNGKKVFLFTRDDPKPAKKKSWWW